MNDGKLDKSELRKNLASAARELPELGGIKAFRNGDWLLNLIGKSFTNYFERATPDYFCEKYPGFSREQIAQKLINVASTNAALAGAATGAIVSTDEIVALFTAGEGGIGLPANIAVALTAVSAEILFTTRLQLQLVAGLGALYDVPLDPEDPEDILIILSFAFGGGIAELAGKEGMKVGGKLAEATIRKYIKKDQRGGARRVRPDRCMVEQEGDQDGREIRNRAFRTATTKQESRRDTG
jgi:hypothetical protein